jgi:hypothetical protein
MEGRRLARSKVAGRHGGGLRGRCVANSACFGGSHVCSKEGVTLQEASCTGEPGARVFSGKGTAIRNSKKGYTVSLSIKEAAGGFFFESKVMKGAEEVEANGGPLKTTTQTIS